MCLENNRKICLKVIALENSTNAKYSSAHRLLQQQNKTTSEILSVFTRSYQPLKSLIYDKTNLTLFMIQNNV